MIKVVWMLCKNTIINIRSIIQIIITDYEKDSLPKLHRIGNRMFRPEYSDQDGIAYAEAILFSNIPNSNVYQSLQEHVKLHQPIDLDRRRLIDAKDLYYKERLNADVFYKLNRIESQKTSHACLHAANFMLVDYARQYYANALESEPKCQALRYLNEQSLDSGYDSGVGDYRLSKALATLGLFTQAEPRHYDLVPMWTLTWPSDPDELAQYLAFYLFFYGLLSMHIKHDEPYGHQVTVTGVIRDPIDLETKVIYADPWEGQMMVVPIYEFTTLLQAAAAVEHNAVIFNILPLSCSASFAERIINQLPDITIEQSQVLKSS